MALNFNMIHFVLCEIFHLHCGNFVYILDKNKCIHYTNLSNTRTLEGEQWSFKFLSFYTKLKCDLLGEHVVNCIFFYRCARSGSSDDREFCPLETFKKCIIYVHTFFIKIYDSSSSTSSNVANGNRGSLDRESFQFKLFCSCHVFPSIFLFSFVSSFCFKTFFIIVKTSSVFLMQLHDSKNQEIHYYLPIFKDTHFSFFRDRPRQ